MQWPVLVHTMFRRPQVDGYAYQQGEVCGSGRMDSGADGREYSNSR